MSIILVEDLVRQFGDFTAVYRISFSVEPGEIFGFLGPNGAGKSTTIKILATLLRPTSGRAVLADHDIRTQPDGVRRSIGMVFQDSSLDERLTAEENLFFHALMYDVPKSVLTERMESVLQMVDLADRRKSLVKTFSGGMKRRLEIARGLLHYPKVLFLDEPTVGLDPQTRASIWAHIRHLREQEGVTVFMTTHYMDEAENCDRIAIVDHGKIVALDTPANLKRMVGGDVVTLKGENNAVLADGIASRYELAVTADNDTLRLEVKDGSEFIPRLVSDFPGQIKSIGLHQPTLDDVFLKLTGRAIREETASNLDAMRARRRMFAGGRR